MATAAAAAAGGDAGGVAKLSAADGDASGGAHPADASADAGVGAGVGAAGAGVATTTAADVADAGAAGAGVATAAAVAAVADAATTTTNTTTTTTTTTTNTTTTAAPVAPLKLRAGAALRGAPLPGSTPNPAYGLPASPTAAAAAPTAAPAKKRAAGAAEPGVPLRALFRFATPLDVTLVAAAVVAATVSGAVLPLEALLVGNLINSTSDAGTFASTVDATALYMTLLAVASFVLNFVATGCLFVSSERQIRAARVAYMRAILRQDMAYYDTHAMAEAVSRIADDTIQVREGLGEKLAVVVSGVATFIGGFVLAFTVARDAWMMALVVLGFVPAVGAVFTILFKVLTLNSGNVDDAYARAGRVATETFSLLRTVAAFGGEDAAVARYDACLADAEAAGRRGGAGAGLSTGVFVATLNALYAVTLYAGARLLLLNRESHPACAFDPLGSDCFAGGAVIQVLFSLVNGAAAFGIVIPNLSAIAGAKSAARRIWQLIDRRPAIDSLDAGGVTRDAAGVVGRIQFVDVSFAYPSRPTEPVLRNLNLTLEPGTVTGVAGASGCGKSTLIALLQRWYDPTAGVITLDGVDLRSYNVAWLRQQMALVSQEPQLLPGSVADNIADGVAHGAPSAADMEDAARAANLHDFITSLPQGYATPVTTSQLSGGQKQRLAIARALVRRSRLLLLDEATSALDSTAERAIQADLDRLLRSAAPAATAATASAAAPRRTALVIAQRLSTLTAADRIVVLRDGAVAEAGSHAELVAAGGQYAAMYAGQRLQGVDAAPATTAPAAPPAAPAAGVSAEHVAVAVAGTPRAAPPAAPPAAVVPLSPTAAAGAATSKRTDDEVDDATLADPSKSKDWQALPRVSLWKVWPYARPETGWYLLASAAALANGVMLPAFSVVLSRFTTIYFLRSADAMKEEAAKYMGIFFALAVAAFVLQGVQGAAFARGTEAVTRRLRRAAFRALVRQPVAVFDLPDNSVGRVTARLGTTAARLRTALGPGLGDKLSAFATIVSGLAVAFAASWQLALIIIVVAPALLASAGTQTKVTFGLLNDARVGFAAAATLAVDATAAVRVVTAFGLQARVLARFERALAPAFARALRRGWVLAAGVGVAEFFQPAATALIFWVGAQLITDGAITFQAMLQCFFALQFSTHNLRKIGNFGSDVATLDGALRILFSIIDAPSAIDPLAPPAMPGAAPATRAAGALELRDVTFAYPARPRQPVLRGLSLTIPAGTTAAIVGPSGCGKSTVVQLLLRFYDPTSGALLLDGRDLRAYSVAWVRNQMGWVQQEAPLWADTIANNIAYGRASALKPAADAATAADAAADADADVPADVRAAASAAAADGFIHDFAAGYATKAGDRGSQLSGGQKQRVAIARALVRAPRVLLLDEATSALDTRSEAAVQASIDGLLAAHATTAAPAERPTVLIVAHRLRTIRNVDTIFVLDAGRLVETGSYAHLMARADGAFRRMVLAQDPAAAHADAAAGAVAPPPHADAASL